MKKKEIIQCILCRKKLKRTEEAQLIGADATGNPVYRCKKHKRMIINRYKEALNAGTLKALDGVT